MHPCHYEYIIDLHEYVIGVSSFVIENETATIFWSSYFYSSISTLLERPLFRLSVSIFRWFPPCGRLRASVFICLFILHQSKLRASVSTLQTLAVVGFNLEGACGRWSLPCGRYRHVLGKSLEIVPKFLEITPPTSSNVHLTDRFTPKQAYIVSFPVLSMCMYFFGIIMVLFGIFLFLFRVFSVLFGPFLFFFCVYHSYPCPDVHTVIKNCITSISTRRCDFFLSALLLK